MLYKKVACCTDFSENSNAAFKSALEICKTFKAKLYIIHAIPPMINPMLTEIEIPLESKQSLLLKIEEQMQAQYGEKIEGIEYEFVVLDGHVSTEIVNYLKEKKIDLVVVGSFGLSGMELVLFGSVAKRIAHKAPCSVTIVR